MTLAEAANVWEEEKREIALRQARLDVAAQVLKEYFRAHPDKRDYKGRIGFAIQSRLQLDTDAVKVFLGKRLEKYQKRVTYESLSLMR